MGVFNDLCPAFEESSVGWLNVGENIADFPAVFFKHGATNENLSTDKLSWAINW